MGRQTTHLTAAEGMWLTDGTEVFAKTVHCPAEYAERWHEVTDEYKEQWEREHQPEEETINEE